MNLESIHAGQWTDQGSRRYLGRRYRYSQASGSAVFLSGLHKSFVFCTFQ